MTYSLVILNQLGRISYPNPRFDINTVLNFGLDIGIEMLENVFSIDKKSHYYMYNYKFLCLSEKTRFKIEKN